MNSVGEERNLTILFDSVQDSCGYAYLFVFDNGVFLHGIGPCGMEVPPEILGEDTCRRAIAIGLMRGVVLNENCDGAGIESCRYPTSSSSHR